MSSVQLSSHHLLRDVEFQRSVNARRFHEHKAGALSVVEATKRDVYPAAGWSFSRALYRFLIHYMHGAEMVTTQSISRAFMRSCDFQFAPSCNQIGLFAFYSFALLQSKIDIRIPQEKKIVLYPRDARQYGDSPPMSCSPD